MMTIVLMIVFLFLGGTFMHLYHEDNLRKKKRILEEMSTANKYRAFQGSIVSNTGRTYVSGLTDQRILEDAVKLRNAVYKEAIEDARIIFE